MQQKNVNVVNENVGQATPDNGPQGTCNLISRQVSPDLQAANGRMFLPKHCQAMPALHGRQRAGFTLIELLVVVLIIGILAAVAVPQYQKAVEKSRAAQALTLLKSVAQAAETYYMANGTEMTSFDELAIDIPWPTASTVIGMSQETRSNGQWALEKEYYSTIGSTSLFMTRLDGKYRGAGFRILLADSTGHTGTLESKCFERKSDATVLFDASLTPGAYCAQIMKGTLAAENQWTRTYTLP